jgi:hypothetical protein
MAWSLRFEPVEILFQAKAGNQNSRDFAQNFLTLKRAAVARVAFSAHWA